MAIFFLDKGQTTLTEPVCCLFAYKITYLWNIKIIFFFLDTLKHNHCTRAKTTDSLIVIIIMLIVNYPTPTYVKEVCAYFFYFLSSLRGFPASLSPASLICHQWILGNFLVSSPLLLVYNIGGKTAISQSTSSVS